MMDLFAKAAELGLETESLRLHRQRIVEKIPQPLFSVIDSCRIDNGAILPLPARMPARITEQVSAAVISNFATLVPAAGAASRYLKPLQPLFDAYSRDSKKIDVASDLLASPMPEVLRSWLATPTSLAALLAVLPACKAMYPCTQDGISFLQMKDIEHRSIGKFDQQFYVVPMQTEFRTELSVDAHCLEQSAEFCTLRFHPDGEPVMPLSIVPAGHGVLAGMFKRLRTLTDAHSLFIRNIDNVMGTGGEAIAATRAFLVFHDFLLQQIRKIRSCLAMQDMRTAEATARTIITEVFGEQKAESESPLHYLMKNLFHSDPSCSAYPAGDSLLSLYQRPLTLFGQVRNTGSDKGGVPVFVNWKQQPIKICLETPHMSEADAQTHKATHFNPVFVACELTDAYDYSPFWLLAKKTYRGTDVMYHESLLYEALSNSMHCNSVYLEVPRALFNPHKLITDGKGNTKASWGL